MRIWILAFMAAMVLITSGCASSGGTAATVAAVDSGNLPEIAPYDDEAFEALPDMVPAGQ